MPGIPIPFEAIVEQPWALLRSTLQQVVDSAVAGTALQAAVRQPTLPRREGTVAVLPIRGVIEHHASMLGDLLGGTSIDAIRASFRDAMASADVLAVVLDIDSPGGGTQGVTELAQEIREARGGKPIVAVANGTAASAAYWLATQADRLYVTPSGQVGSVGVYAVHQDMSRALEAEGITTTIVSAGDHKTEGNEFQPLTDDARAYLQRRVDAHYALMMGDVAKGRGVTPEDVHSGYGGGRALLAADALAAGMVDEVGTLETAIRHVAHQVRATRSMTRAEGDPPAIRSEDEPDETIPFRVRVHHQATDLAALVAHANARADLRSREHRPAFSPDVEASLRSIRDDALTLAALLPADPVQSVAASPPVVEPPVVVAPIRSVRRFASREDWLRYLEASAPR